jgi:glycosyltransferase involved in cell wall biosynthesis
LHLPQLFPGLDVAAETRRLQGIIETADAIVLSSQAALGDFRSIAPASALARAAVLRFVSQPRISLAVPPQPLTAAAIEGQYGLRGRFFYLPNQFWSHKNHRVVFEAVRLLKERGEDVVVVCSGNLHDYRLGGTQYADELRSFIAAHGLGDNLRIFGLVPYEHVLFLMRHCIAVLNPSRFEGWSSTVEEARSIGKRLVLSDIAVHLEQDPPGARYFSPDDAAALAKILSELWRAAATEGVDHEAEQRARSNLHERTVEYGRGFIDLVKQLSGISARADGHAN